MTLHYYSETEKDKKKKAKKDKRKREAEEASAAAEAEVAATEEKEEKSEKKQKKSKKSKKESDEYMLPSQGEFFFFIQSTSSSVRVLVLNCVVICVILAMTKTCPCLMYTESKL